MRSRFVLITVFCVLAMRSTLAGEAAPAAPANRLTLSTERVVIFKDGYGLFIKAATGTADPNGRVFTDALPDGAVLGCFWATTDQNHALPLSAEWQQNKEERVTQTPCIATVELLRVNRGKKVVLGLTREHAADVSGTIVEVLDLPPEKQPAPVRSERSARDAAMSWRPEGETAAPAPGLEVVRELTPRGGQLVVVNTAEGMTILPVAEVRTITGPDLVTKMERRESVTTWAKRLSIDLGKENAGQKAALHIFYFAEGVRWIPTYRLSGALEDKADLALQGEILNEAEDFQDAAVDLVVGVPNFRFKNTISPLSLEKTLRNALALAAPSLSNQLSNGNNMVMRQSAGAWEAQVPPEGRSVLNLAPELAAGGQQDLFVYGVKSLSLKKGGRTTVALWQDTAPLRHVYTLEIKTVRDGRSGSALEGDGTVNPGYASPLHLARNEIWHQYELGNTSKLPWTTGAALILKNTLPLGQELLTYTPAGGQALLPVTVAVDMRGSYQEEELARQPNALRWGDHNYSKVHKKATLTIRNSRTEASFTRVSVSLGGLAEKADNEGKIRLNDFRAEYWCNQDYPLNNHSDVSWEFTLDPNLSKTLTFEFSFYVP